MSMRTIIMTQLELLWEIAYLQLGLNLSFPFFLWPHGRRMCEIAYLLEITQAEAAQVEAQAPSSITIAGGVVQ